MLERRRIPIAQMLAVLVLLIVLFGLSCGRRAVDTPAPSRHLPYLELQPGWRLVVISPDSANASGQLAGVAFQPSSPSVDTGNTQSLTLTAKVPESFGYVRATIDLRGRDASVSFHFSRTEHIQNGRNRSIPPTPALRNLFPKGRGRARMLFLTRVADTEHDTAILRAPTPEALEALTAGVLASPLDACRTQGAVVCEWAPRGVAVRAERPVKEGDRWTWKDVF